MFRIMIAATILAAGVAGAAQAQIVTPQAAVHAGAYSVEPYHTRVLFAVSHFGFTTYYGNFTGVTGALTLDPKKPSASKLNISIPSASVSTTNPKLDGELKSADWFDAGKYPAINFTSTAVTPEGHGTARVIGDLTLHGVTKPVTLQVKFNGAGVNPIDKAYTAGFEVSGTLKRSDFGVTKYVPYVGDDVTLIISAAFEQKS